MHLSKEEKKDIFSKYGNSPEDTGSTEGQLAMFTKRIQHLTEHLKKNKWKGGKINFGYRIGEDSKIEIGKARGTNLAEA